MSVMFSFSACALWLCVVSASLTSYKISRYLRCPQSGVSTNGNIIASMTSSRLRCFQECSEDDRCKSVNVCPVAGEENWSHCELLDSYTMWSCRQLETPSDPRCFHSEKTDRCLNGGRLLDDNSCKCDLCFKGDICTERYRDCTEAAAIVSNGYQGQVTCYIHPASAPQPFPVQCAFGQYPSTLVLLRVQNSSGWSQLDWPNYKWDDYKAGMGDKSILNYFIGLENLRHFLLQAEYRLNMFNTYHSSVAGPVLQPAYKTLTLKDESQRYALAYSLYSNNFPLDTRDLEAFRGAGFFHPFCTPENDCGTCAQRNGPGWYFQVNTSTCVGYSPFASIAKWPYEGEGELTIASTLYSLERVGAFY